MTFAEELPVYTSKIQQTIDPISRKIQKSSAKSQFRLIDINPKVQSYQQEATMFGYGILGTIVVILVIVWLVKRV